MSAHATTRPITEDDGASLVAILDELARLVTDARAMPMSAVATPLLSVTTSID